MAETSPNPHVTRDHDSLRKIYAATGTIAVAGFRTLLSRLIAFPATSRSRATGLSR